MIDETVLVLGMGRTGKSAQHFFKERGIKVLCFDDHPTEKEKVCHADHSDHSENLVCLDRFEDIPFSEISFIVQSPGFSKEHPVYQEACKRNIPVFSDIDVFVKAVRGSCVIGITGTNGKSTTTALTYHILHTHFPEVYVGGNIGVPALQLPIKSNAFYVLELSSFQLELSHELHLDVAVLTNISEDHLNRHKTMDNYVKAKEKIFDGVKYGVVCCDDAWTKKICTHLEQEQKFDLKEIFLDHNPILKEQLRSMTSLPGDHNLQNVALAVEIARWTGMSEQEISKAVGSFTGLEHRIEPCGKWGNVSFFNDSKATNADSLIQALKSFMSGERVFLIAGGRAKTDGIVPALPFMQAVEEFFLIGEAMDRFKKELLVGGIDEQKIHLCETLDAATQKAFHQAQRFASDPEKKSIVLLSPACASFDQFSGFEEKGAFFKQNVQKILSKVEYEV